MINYKLGKGEITMKTFLVGVGAAGNKAVLSAVETGVVNVDDTMIVNTTSKDFPKEYEGQKIMLSDGDTGCGKERGAAKEYAQAAMKEGKFNLTQKMAGYTTVIIVTSVEGGTGSGATPLIAKMFSKVYVKNVHIIAFTGFEDDVRGLANTVEFFKEIDPAIIVQTISNKAFMNQANNNKLRAEELANYEMGTRIRVLTGQDFIEGRQNIDDTDILKLSNTSGYMTVEKKVFNKPLETNSDYERIVKNMIYNSASIHCENPAPQRIGVILNIKPESEDAVDFTFDSIKKEYCGDGKAFEMFTQVQWDGKKEYIAYIVSGMKMPIDEVKAIYDRYIEETNKIDKANDDFFADVQSMKLDDADKKFNMIREVNKGMSITDFLNEN